MSGGFSISIVIPIVMVVGFIFMGLFMFLGRNVPPMAIVIGIVMVGVVIVALIAMFVVSGSVANQASSFVQAGGC